MKHKRKMPAHIVLPNGMWRFVKSGSKKVSSVIHKRKHKTRRVKKSYGGVSMRRRTHRKSSRGFGGSGLMSGIIKPRGIFAQALVGAGTASICENAGITQSIPYGKYVAGFATAGVAGVGGVFARDMLKGTMSSSSNVSYEGGY